MQNCKKLSNYQIPNFVERYKAEGKLKIARIEKYFNFVMFILVSGFLIFYLYTYDTEIVYETEINYHNLSVRQIEHIESVLEEVKPYLLERTRSLDFYKDDELPKGFYDSKSKVGGNTLRRISLEYDHNFRLILCHELLHNWISEELPVYDLSRIDEVCYVNEDWRRPNLFI